MSRTILLIFILGILLAGCANPPQAATQLNVEATDFAFNPVSITVPVGEPVTLTMINHGAFEHDYVIETIEVTDVVASETGPAEHHQMGHAADYDLHFFARAGEEATLQFTALEPGTYEVFCSIEGHKAAGMVGELIVVARD